MKSKASLMNQRIAIFQMLIMIWMMIQNYGKHDKTINKTHSNEKNFLLYFTINNISR